MVRLPDFRAMGAMVLGIARKIRAYLFGGKLDNYHDEDYKAILFPEKSTEQEKEELEPQQTTACEHRIGIVTKLEPHGMIDRKYYFDTADLQQKNIKVDQRVKYVAYRLRENADWTIRQIRVVEQDEWGMGVEETSASQVIRRSPVITKILPARIVNRRGRIITMEPNNMNCHLDRVQSEFLPIEGDEIQLTAIVGCREDERFDEYIVDIKSLKPLRSKTYEGKVSSLSDMGTEGIVDSEIFFTNDVCNSGIMPGLNDKVVVRAIQSSQGTLQWRAILLIVLESSLERPSLLSKIQEERLFESKHGVKVEAECDKKSLKIGEQTTFKVKIENAGTEAQTLTSVVLTNSDISKVMKLTTEFSGNLTVGAGCFEELEVVATARSSGQYSEIIVFQFRGGWEIRCLLDINVHIDDKYEKHLTATKHSSMNDCNNENGNYSSADSRCRNGDGSYQKFRSDRQQRMRAARTMPTSSGFVVPGVRPVKPMAFIPRRLLDFPIPENLKTIMLDESKDVSTKQAELEDTYPFLVEQLRDSNYLSKFHMLLHMEDLEHLCAIKKFDSDRVCFTRQGEFLVLEISNLAECKPSLVVGDKLHATDLITNENPEKPGKVNHEGFIHKVTSNSIKLKFNESFHNQYDGKSMSVTFFHSRTGFMRAHQALNEVEKHFGRTWLFPNGLGSLKSEQVNIDGEYPRTNISDMEHVCQSDQSSEQVVAACAPKPEPKKFRKPLVSRQKKITLAMLDDAASEESDEEKPPKEPAEKPPKEPTENGVSQSTHSYAKIERPGCADRPIKWEEEDRRKGAKPRYAEKNTPPKPVERVNMIRRNEIVKWINPALNKYQKFAVRNILKGEARPLPYIIQGPPGTGKTVTLVETILQIMFLMPESRILVATPSNSSADLLCERLLSWKLLNPGDLVRLVGYNYMLENRMSAVVKPYCTCLDTKSVDKNAPQISYDDDGVKYSHREVVGLNRITVSTCVSTGNLYTMGFPKNHFTHVIIDEAGQITEPDIMIPLAFLDGENGQAVLAGDPKQLGPVIISNVAGSMGLGDSLLNRLYSRFPYLRDQQGFPETQGYDPRLVTTLKYNYRSLPNILELYNTLFYAEDLIPKVCAHCSPEKQMFDKIKDALKDHSQSSDVGQVIFNGVRGTDLQDDDSPSWYNEHEVARVVAYLSILNQAGIKSDDIGIVTPYQKQVRHIRQFLQQLDLDAPKVGTVEEFQGQERNVIIISTVRSNNKRVENDLRHSLGFVKSESRLNVAISRARALLIIIGDPYLLACDHKWAQLIKLCVKRGYYEGCDLPAGLRGEVSPFRRML